jgi:mRNA interferase RelE/StbE
MINTTIKDNLLILRRAQKELTGLTGSIYNKIINAILSLNNEPRPHGFRKLIGREGFRIRIGDYRIIYEIDDLLLRKDSLEQMEYDYKY